MRDWFGVYFGLIGSWLIAAVNWNEITLAFACVASVATALTAVICGVQKIMVGHYNRESEQHRKFKDECEAMLARDKVCDECIDDGGSFVDDCVFTHRHKNCPKPKITPNKPP